MYVTVRTFAVVVPALLLMASCAWQDSHFIRVQPPDGRRFAAEDCDVLTDIVHEVAGTYRLPETQGVSDRDSFPRYRDYWSEASVIGIHLFCNPDLLAVNVTALRHDVRDPTGTAYRRSISSLSADIASLFASRIEESEDSILVRTYR